MEHPCQGCGAAVEDSTPFCSSCGAPQVRFSARAPSSNPTVAGPGPPNVPPAGVSWSSYVRVEAQPPISYQVASFDRQAAVRSALNAGAIAAVLSLLPFGFILALPLAGFLGVLLYRRRSSAQAPSPGAGFKLGALCGVFGFAIFIILTAVNTLAFHAQKEFRSAMVEAVRHAQARNPDPQARQMLEYFTSPQGLVVMMALGFVFICVAFVLLSGLGGAMSAALLRRKGPPA